MVRILSDVASCSHGCTPTVSRRASPSGPPPHKRLENRSHAIGKQGVTQEPVGEDEEPKRVNDEEDRGDARTRGDRSVAQQFV
jgi:hypothetical protein